MVNVELTEKDLSLIGALFANYTANINGDSELLFETAVRIESAMYSKEWHIVATKLRMACIVGKEMNEVERSKELEMVQNQIKEFEREHNERYS